MESVNRQLRAPNLICIAIDKHDQYEYAGRIWHQYADQPISFVGTMRLIQTMDGLYDEWNFPQRSTMSRSFRKKEVHAGSEKKEEVELIMNASRVQNKSGDEGTFIVHVKYRQNSTWQGDVVWVEQKKRKSFRSALELLKMIDEALEAPAETADLEIVNENEK